MRIGRFFDVLAATGCALLAACSANNQSNQDPLGSPPTASAKSTASGSPGSAWVPRVAGEARRLSPAHTAQPRAVPGEYLVKFRSFTAPAFAASTLEASAFRIRRSFRSVPGLHHIALSAGAAEAEAVARLAARPDVEYVEPNFRVTALATPNDPLFPKLWQMNNTGQLGSSSTVNPDIGALAAWDITTGSKNVVIAVIDSGIDYTHPDLAPNIWSNPGECNGNGLDNDGDGYVNDCHGINAITHGGDPMDDLFHGTHVAGIIGAVGNNAVGVTGVNWNVTLLPCKFLDSTGSGNIADAVTCLDYIALQKDRGVNIIASNNSWSSAEGSQALRDAIVAQRVRGILLVAAAGNDGNDNDLLPTYPCSYDLANVICVASAVDGRSIFSNFGMGTVHLGAPGEAIWSTVPNNDYAAHDGTSMAAPHVTGVLGLLKAQDPSRDWRALKNLVLAGAVPPVEGAIYSITGGRLNAQRSLTCSNSVVEARMRPGNFETITLAVGATLSLEATNINCAQPNGEVTVTVSPSGETITLHDDGLGPDEVAGDGVYAGTWTAGTPGAFTLTFPGRPNDEVSVVVDGQLRPGFPAKMTMLALQYNFANPPGVSLIVGDIDGGPGNDILAPGYDGGPLYAWKGDGTPVPGWPNYGVYSTAEVTLGTFSPGAHSSGVLAAFLLDGMRLYNGDGSDVPGWPQTPATVLYPVPTVDVDGDGRDEILSRPMRHADGSRVNETVVLPAGPPEQAPIEGPTAVADLDADGQPDFILANNAQAWASNVQGLLYGYPITLTGGLGASPTPVIGDVDGDGRPEILLPFSTYQNGAPFTNIAIYSSTGTLQRTLVTSQTAPQSVVALGDLDGDGIPEIVLTSGPAAYAWKGSGAVLPGWPVSLPPNSYAGPAAIGDVDGDGFPDIVFVVADGNLGGAVWALDRHGISLPGFPKPLVAPVLGVGSPAIADLDGNGHNEIIVSRMTDFGRRDNIFVYELKGPGPYGPVEWSQYMGDGSHRGYYETGKNLPNAAYLSMQVHGAGTVASLDGGINCGAACMHKYAKGTSVKLSATPGPGATFSRWLGPCAGQGNPCTLNVARYTPVAADFASPITLTVTGQGKVTSSPAGLACPATCSASFPARTTVTLTASPGATSALGGWGGACSGASTSCVVYIDSAKSVTAQFVDARSLTVSVGGPGHAHITSTPAGIDCPSTCSAYFAPGTAVTLSASPAADSYLTNWGLAGCQASVPTCSVTMNTDVAEVITTALKPAVNITVTHSGSVVISGDGTVQTCTASCSYPFTPGAPPMNLTAQDSTTVYFTEWDGACTGNFNLCTLFLADTSMSVTANFAPKPQLTVSTDGSGQGTVTSGDGLLSCPGTCVENKLPGTSVTLQAQAHQGSTFTGWNGGCSGGNSTCSLTLSANTSVRATFNSDKASGGSSGGGGAFDLVTAASILGLLGLRGRSKRLPVCWPHLKRMSASRA